MKTVIDILEELESDNSRLFKEELLRKNKSNSLLKRVFVAVGDPYTNFYVNKFKMPKAPTRPDAGDDECLTDYLDFVTCKLATRELTGNAAKNAVLHEFSLMDNRQQKWCQRILLRNLRVGVSESTVAKIWPGAVAKFSVQLAETLKSHFEDGVGIVIDEPVDFPVRVEPKLDGLRCISVKHNGEVTMFTRSGSPIDTLPTIKAALDAAPWDDFVLDSEAIGADWNESASVVMSRKNNKNDSGMVLNVFDAMHFDDWVSQTSETSTKLRCELVSELVRQVENKCVVAVEGESVNDMKSLMKYYSKVMAKGYEGIMLKDIDAVYRFKRTDAVLKLKPVQTFEGVIVAHYEGNRGSKREGMWGGFEVLMPNGVITKCGGGFNDKIRAEISIDPDRWIGRIVELEGQPDPLTADGLTVDGKVRFPVYIRERDARDVDSKVLNAYNAWKKSSR